MTFSCILEIPAWPRPEDSMRLHGFYCAGIRK